MLLETLSTSPKICLHLCLESFSYVMSGSQALRNQTLTMLVAGRVKPVKEKTAIHDEPTRVRLVRSASYGIGPPSVVSPQSLPVAGGAHLRSSSHLRLHARWVVGNHMFLS